MRLPVDVVRGEGIYLIDAFNRKYLSFAESINILGYSNSAVKRAISRQTNKLIHFTNELSPAEECLELGRRLAERGGSKRGAIFTCSGTEANEYALLEFGAREGALVVGIIGSYHGQLYFTGAITRGKSAGRVLLVKPDNEGMGKLEEALREASGNAVAIIEPLMVHAGIKMLPKEFIDFINKQRNANQLKVIVDEVYLSPAKAGSFYSHHVFGLTGDALTLGKSVGGGLPLGAIIPLGSARIWSPLGITATSQGGNRTACAAGLALLREVDRKGLIEHVKKTGESVAKLLRDEFEGLPGVKETRGIGFIHGIELDARVYKLAARKRLVERAAAHGLLVSLMGMRNEVVRLSPPLIATYHDWVNAVSVIKKALGEVL